MPNGAQQILVALVGDAMQFPRRPSTGRQLGVEIRNHADDGYISGPVELGAQICGLRFARIERRCVGPVVDEMQLALGHAETVVEARWCRRTIR